MDPKTVQLSGACAITHFTIAVWVDGSFKQIAVPFVNKNGSFSELENKSIYMYFIAEIKSTSDHFTYPFHCLYHNTI